LKKIAIAAAAVFLAGCGSSAAASHTAFGRQDASKSASQPSAQPSSCGSAVGPTGQPLCGTIAHVSATTDHPPENSNLIATCKPTGTFADGNFAYTLKISYPNSMQGLVPITIREVAVFALVDGTQGGGNPYQPYVSPPVTLNPGSKITLHLSSPMNFSPDNQISCTLSGVNFYES
jgi:hypothetical protein